MAHAKGKNWIRISASPQLSSGTTVATDSIDLSAYVDPLHSLAFRIQTVSMTLMENQEPYGLMNTSSIIYPAFALQMATGGQAAILRPSDGKVIYHQFGSYIHDVDATTITKTMVWKVTDVWPDGYVAVVDSLTAMAQSSAALGASYRFAWTLTGYQEKVSANQLASLLVAQTA